MAEENPQGAPAQGQTWQETPPEKTMRRWYEMMMAERLAQLDHLMKTRALLRRGAKKMQDGLLGQPGEPGDGEEEEMHITIGDSSVANYYAAPATQAPPAANGQSAAPQPSGQLVSKLAPIILGLASGVAGGVGTGLAIPQLLNTAATNVPAQVQQQPPAPTPGITILDKGKTDVEAVQLYKPGSPPIEQ